MDHSAKEGPSTGEKKVASPWNSYRQNAADVLTQSAKPRISWSVEPIATVSAMKMTRAAHLPTAIHPATGIVVRFGETRLPAAATANTSFFQRQTAARSADRTVACGVTLAIANSASSRFPRLNESIRKRNRTQSQQDDRTPRIRLFLTGLRIHAAILPICKDGHAPTSIAGSQSTK